MPEQPNFILVDEIIVYSLDTAILNWFKLAKKDETLEDPRNEIFRKSLNLLL